jgi:hypothetical protein
MNNKAIITEIDKALIDAIKVENKRAFGMADFYFDNDKKYPGIIDKEEIINPFLQDQYKLSWYHRTSTSVLSVMEYNYGNKMDKVEETTPVQLIIFTRAALSFETIKDWFVSALPSVLNKAICESLQIFNCTIEVRGTEMNSNVVFKEECTEPNVRVGGQYGLIAIRYEIKTSYRRGCQTFCDCTN